MWHEIQSLARCGGDDKTELSYIIVAPTVVMFTKCGFIANKVLLIKPRPVAVKECNGCICATSQKT